MTLEGLNRASLTSIGSADSRPGTASLLSSKQQHPKNHILRLSITMANLTTQTKTLCVDDITTLDDAKAQLRLAQSLLGELECSSKRALTHQLQRIASLEKEVEHLRHDHDSGDSAFSTPSPGTHTRHSSRKALFASPFVDASDVSDVEVVRPALRFNLSPLPRSASQSSGSRFSESSAVLLLQDEVDDLRTQLASTKIEAAQLHESLIEHKQLVQRQDSLLQEYAHQLLAKARQAPEPILEDPFPAASAVIEKDDPTMQGTDPNPTPATLLQQSLDKSMDKSFNLQAVAPESLLRIRVDVDHCSLDTYRSNPTLVVHLHRVTGTPLPKAWAGFKFDNKDTATIRMELRHLEQTRQALREAYPRCAVPPLLARRTDGAVIEAQAVVCFACQRFLTCVTEHPVLRTHPSVVQLLTGRRPPRNSTVQDCDLEHHGLDGLNTNSSLFTQSTDFGELLTDVHCLYESLAKSAHQYGLSQHAMALKLLQLADHPWLQSNADLCRTLAHLHASSADIIDACTNPGCLHEELQRVSRHLISELGMLVRIYMQSYADQAQQLEACGRLAHTVLDSIVPSSSEPLTTWQALNVSCECYNIMRKAPMGLHRNE
ncbi:uncharacterized protein MONBRDRAFT_28809 [Monosiga brevicollis MX1]|uniref:Uncharacterized protein n=1 Tax=Monosiga brevicollis TaxID=81824 RepID=A9V9H7_MONBE|nr:uncharacterized protein MONBRDRAFT_28809 [Monosiga brevicollis MX1]EDQ85866.1 predicted protein [Monosiga brevicollis MX1]|eukprot:XP_001749345.1 hypothetical protein [Monosiga brevicollis MX1]